MSYVRAASRLGAEGRSKTFPLRDRLTTPRATAIVDVATHGRRPRPFAASIPFADPESRVQTTMVRTLSRPAFGKADQRAPGPHRVARATSRPGRPGRSPLT